ncbi:MAG: hypothetical protein KA277_07940 [Fusobacteriaceae bacterium]|jgi:hypothetical protein|nr:hypothetical protein [Fusobacteriaceae bacterium]MBP6467936.1 hypothetical protein [Fusobacteriaceae bacterium]MBP9595679.1 hypothetical protein [Fusobacteriaceae bacterium]
MSRRSIEDLKFQLEAIRERKVKEKKIFISLDKEKYNRFLTAIVLSNKKDEEMEKTYKKIVNKMVDDFIESVDFYDLTEKDINTIAEMFDEIV